MNATSFLRIALSVGSGLGLALLASVLRDMPSDPVPRGGRRGLARERAVRSVGWTLLEGPVLRFARLLRVLALALRRVNRLRSAVTRAELWARELLVQSGEPAGLDPYGFFALSLVTAGALGGAAALAVAPGSGGLVVPALLLGAALPTVRLTSLRLERFKSAARDMPVTIDLVALAMGAGLDFPGAVRRVVRSQSSVLAEELEHLLCALDLGITRSAALRALEERLPVVEVRDLVRVVVLADKKGASIGDALAQLAVSSRQRRTVRAEEAAARAGALLMIPLVLLLGCVLLLLLGPLLVGGVGL